MRLIDWAAVRNDLRNCARSSVQHIVGQILLDDNVAYGARAVVQGEVLFGVRRRVNDVTTVLRNVT